MLSKLELSREIDKVYARLDELEHIVRQIEGTIEVFVKQKKICFLNKDTEKTFHEVMDKWKHEIGPRKRGPRKRRVA